MMTEPVAYAVKINGSWVADPRTGDVITFPIMPTLANSEAEVWLVAPDDNEPGEVQPVCEIKKERWLLIGAKSE